MAQSAIGRKFKTQEIMAIIDVIQLNNNGFDLVEKHPNTELKYGTQVIVGVGQVAIFIKGGKIYDVLETGTHTLKTENIPLLGKIINIPFGGSSPFQAEIWYVNTLNKLDLKWGTLNPMLLEDPKFNIILPIRAFGQFGLKITDPKLLLESLVGTLPTISSKSIFDYFKGFIISSLNTIISKKLSVSNVSFLEINNHLDDLSEFAIEKLNSTFHNYGIHLVSFNFISINIPEDDESLNAIKEAKNLAAKIKIVGKDLYQMDRTFNVLDKASENEGGISGSLVNGAIGLGLGASMINKMPNLNYIEHQPSGTPPPFQGTKLYYIIFNNNQLGPLNYLDVKSQIEAGKITNQHYIWHQGLANWEKIDENVDFKLFFNLPPPPPFNL